MRDNQKGGGRGHCPWSRSSEDSRQGLPANHACRSFNCYLPHCLRFPAASRQTLCRSRAVEHVRHAACAGDGLQRWRAFRSYYLIESSSVELLATEARRYSFRSRQMVAIVMSSECRCKIELHARLVWVKFQLMRHRIA